MVKHPKTLTINNLPNSVVKLPNHPSNDMGTRQVVVDDNIFLSSEDVIDLNVGDQLRLMGLGNVKITKLKILIPQQLFIDDKFNEGSLEEIDAYTEPHYLELKDGTEIQFIRFGYCRKDSANQAIYTHK